MVIEPVPRWVRSMPALVSPPPLTFTWAMEPFWLAPQKLPPKEADPPLWFQMPVPLSNLPSVAAFAGGIVGHADEAAAHVDHAGLARRSAKIDRIAAGAAGRDQGAAGDVQHRRTAGRADNDLPGAVDDAAGSERQGAVADGRVAGISIRTGERLHARAALDNVQNVAVTVGDHAGEVAAAVRCADRWADIAAAGVVPHHGPRAAQRADGDVGHRIGPADALVQEFHRAVQRWMSAFDNLVASPLMAMPLPTKGCGAGNAIDD